MTVEVTCLSPPLIGAATGFSFLSVSLFLSLLYLCHLTSKMQDILVVLFDITFTLFFHSNLFEI